ncbi:twin-arginine translocase subunit TatC [Arenimonas composti]|uniref:Sec-independent protein translocase protein TatC n=1 Tax=Arenimonas composti TR7-09 = DSM 18010 TaxID=1121013 RepID=A0A091BYV7_9GAMM|nr:twin-arginine translocase subunit TatC [Arenimonas composti]KFN49545.1 hypothetical protein P873_10350 [Arenimonas composti TR7-09 = DSM 18010]
MSEVDPPETLMGHLLELRTRLLRGVVVLLLVFFALVPLAKTMFTRFAAPLVEKLQGNSEIIATQMVSPFFTLMKLAFFVALFITMPYLLYQAWAFVAPGLYRNEKRLALPLLLAAVVLFYLGGAFAWFLVLPTVFGFLANFASDVVTLLPDVAGVLDFVMVILLAFGLSFELPVAVVVLVLTGVATPAQLREFRGYVIVGVFIVAAIITPPDVLSQLMLAIPMCLLYELGIVAGALLRRGAAEAR